jgi:hypothetical protein
MGALPSRESHEGPNTVYFGNNTGVVTFRLPMTPHYFPSADCLAFKEVYRVRDSQSCKYSFNIREASAVLPEKLARDFHNAQSEYWGPEAEAEDLSVHYHDEEVQARLLGNSFSRTDTHSHGRTNSSSRHPHIRASIENRHELYEKLVVQPTKNALIDTDDEMREVYLAEQQWRAAREVVRRHRAFTKQQHMTSEQLSELSPSALVSVDVSEAELEAAEAVPPPRKWLRPIPEVVVERMSMEDAYEAHRAYRARHQEPDSKRTTAPPLRAAADGASSSCDRQGLRRNVGRGPASGECDEAALNVLDGQGRRPFVENETLNEEMLKSYPCFQDTELPFELDEQYMDGRVHMVAYDGVNYLFAYNPDYVRAMGKTVVVDASLDEKRRRSSGAVQSERCRRPFTTTHTVATRQAEDFDDPNQRRAYEIFQPIYARYYIPVMPVRMLGVDGFIPCNTAADENSSGESGVRSAPWMRGVDDDEEEEIFQEKTLPQKYGVAPPPVLRACRFIHAAIGDKILNRMSVLGCMTFRERCINAGLPDAIACPLWGVVELSDIPQLQFQREIELRLLAAIHEIDDGDMRIRDALARQHSWNDYVNFTNSPMYGFMVRAPPERHFRADADGKLREVGGAEDDAASRSCSSSSGGNEPATAAQQQRGHSTSNSSNSRNDKNKRHTIARSSATAKKSVQARTDMAEEEAGEKENNPEAVVTAAQKSGTSRSTGVHPALALSVAGDTNSISSPNSDTESRDEYSGSTSARSAAHSASITIVEHMNSDKTGGKTAPAAAAAATKTTARVKRTRDGHTCIGGCAPPETVEQNAALATAMTNAGLSKSCVAAATAEAGNDSDNDFPCLAQPPAELMCSWSFKRRRLGLTEEVSVNPNFSEEEWMPMVNPLTKDTALALLGVRMSMRGRLALVRYSLTAVHKVLYYLSQASAPIFCLPYVGPPQQCPNVYLENVLRAPSSPQASLPPPTPEQVKTSVAAYAQGKVSCYVLVNVNDRVANPPTSCNRNHYRDDVLMSEAVEAGITSRLILAQIPIKADARYALQWYRKSLRYGTGAAAATGDDAPYAEWPSLLDAPAACDGDVLVVCPRTHRWIRVTTLMVLASLMAMHKKNREKAEELVQPVPVLDLFNDATFASEVELCYNGLLHKNMDSEGMQCHMLPMRNFFSYNGMVELVLDRLRLIVNQEQYEDKDDEGWLVLHEAAPFTADASVTSSSSRTATAGATPHINVGTQSPCFAAFSNQKYVESGQYFIWSFLLMGQRFFLGTKPRFIRLALQRQKQNQRRRLKRKERDAMGTGQAPDGTSTTTTAAATKSTSTRSNASKPGTSENPQLAVGTTSSTPTSRKSALSEPTSLGGSCQPSSLAGSTPLSAPPQDNGGGIPASTTTPPTNIPITAADHVQLAHEAMQLHQNHNASQSMSPPSVAAAAAAAAHHDGQRTTRHVPYAPLHLISDDLLADDECNEMQKFRQRHRQWMAARGVCFAQLDRSTTLTHHGDHVQSLLPLSSACDTSRWEVPPLAGQQPHRRRLVVPVGPHGAGRPRYIDCEDLQKGVDGIADAFIAHSTNSRSHTITSTPAQQDNEEANGVPVQKAGTPRVVDAQKTSYRWDPYRVVD